MGQAVRAGLVLPASRVRHQPRPELLAAAVQAGHDGAERGPHDLGDLLVGVALDVGQVDRGAEALRQLAQGPQNVGVGQPVHRLVLGRPGRLAEQAVGDMQLAELAEQRLGGLAPALAPGVDERVGEDAVQPRAQVRARSELMESDVRPGEGVLDQVLGVARVAGHPERCGVQLVHIGDHVLLERRMVVRDVPIGQRHGRSASLSSPPLRWTEPTLARRVTYQTIAPVTRLTDYLAMRGQGRTVGGAGAAWWPDLGAGVLDVSQRRSPVSQLLTLSYLSPYMDSSGMRLTSNKPRDQCSQTTTQGGVKPLHT